MAGRPGASPYAAMTLGILLLYLLFAIPYVGWLFWLAATWLVVRHVIIFGHGHGLQRAIIDESQHRAPERLIMAQH